MNGEPIRGILHNADASSGVEIPIYNAGELTARTLAADEYIEIHSISVVIAAASGDTHVFIGADATAGDGETVIRFDGSRVAGISIPVMCHAGGNGHKPYVVAAAGVVDVVFTGVVRKGKTVTTRQPWKEDE